MVAKLTKERVESVCADRGFELLLYESSRKKYVSIAKNVIKTLRSIGGARYVTARFVGIALAQKWTYLSRLGVLV